MILDANFLEEPYYSTCFSTLIVSVYLKRKNFDLLKILNLKKKKRYMQNGNIFLCLLGWIKLIYLLF